MKQTSSITFLCRTYLLNKLIISISICLLLITTILFVILLNNNKNLVANSKNITEKSAHISTISNMNDNLTCSKTINGSTLVASSELS